MNHIILAASVQGGLSTAAITQYLFWIGTVAMGCGTAFFWLEKNSVLPRYRSALTVAGIVTAVACFHYFRMAGIYASGSFPTSYRYIDWIITTPLLLVDFPLMLGLNQGGGRRFLLPLIALDVAMIVTAYIAEVSAIGSTMWWAFFLIACAFELAIVATLYVTMGSSINSAPAPIAAALRTMRLFILVGWVIYPIGFLMALSGTTGGDLREIFYNIADVINKVGFGLVVYGGIRAMSELDAVGGSTRTATV